jgi:potA: polyamine ABC transporter, ATP-binding protein
MSEIALRNVCKQFDSEHYGVKDFDLDIHDKEFVIFVGPSGCGKSTTLRIIAGLEEITDGELWIDGELSNYLEPKERGMSMVFQNYALYPNMTVYGNMAYALKIRKMPKDEIDKKVHEVAKILEIEQLLDRKPAALSGGQKQRVAIGSAIIRKPKAFLMDEPLSNLDAKLRAQMRMELVKLHKQLDTTIIYVTHDQTEAMTLGTKIVVMKDGLIQQVGAPQSIYDNPVNLFVAGFLGSPSMNFFQCTVKAEENNRTALLLDDAKTVKKVYLDGTRGKQIADRYNGRHVILGIRPEDIYELEEAKKLGIENDSVDVDEPVVNREMLGAEVILYFDEQGKTLAVRLNPENQTKVGEKVSLYFDMDKAHVFDPETEENLFTGRKNNHGKQQQK